jgi:hypothetical protein
MKVTATVLLAAAAIAPVVAHPFEAEDSLVTREDNEFESSFARDFDVDDVELEEREFDDDLYPRRFFGSGSGWSSRRNRGAVYGVVPDRSRIKTREFDDDLYPRRFFGSGSGSSSRSKRRHAAVRADPTQMNTREFDEELHARELHNQVGKILQKHAGFAGSSIIPPKTHAVAREFDADLFERGFEDELYERNNDASSNGSHGGGSSHGGHGGGSSHDPGYHGGGRPNGSHGGGGPHGGRGVDEMEFLEREYSDDLLLD